MDPNLRRGRESRLAAKSAPESIGPSRRWRILPASLRDTGATMVEYVIGLILLALAVTVAVRFFGEKVGQKYDCAAARLDDMSGTFLKAGCTANTPTPTPIPSPTPIPTPTPLPTATPAPAFACYTCHAAPLGAPCPPGFVRATRYPQYCVQVLYQ